MCRSECSRRHSIRSYQISDDHVFFETKKFCQDMVTGFVKLNGMTVGAVANRTKVYDAEGKKRQRFARFSYCKGLQQGSRLCTIL